MRLGTAAITFILCATSADAAITVVGNGRAHACYAAAENQFRSADSEDVCTAALENDPLTPRNRAATYVNRGVIRTGARHLDAALADYEQAIAMGGHLSRSDLGVAYVDRASVLCAMTRYREAIDSVNQGLGLGTSRPEMAFYVRAVAEDEMGDLRSAYFDYKQAVAIRPDFAAAARQLTRFHVEYKPADGS
ncbi:MAG TPA: tetratricopeptide repeat protein [Rhizomicrobium sp.]|nr:tetratricopeptide repeat protein [Rhizomicrobium sp.]